jgi:hypothetical protein
MVAIGVSEFTYGFAFLFEQVDANWLGVAAAPILPSLQTEQMTGWDVSIPLFGVPFFYQFKIPEYLSASHATYIGDGTYGGPYYRIDLHRRENNRQHRLLKTLANAWPNTFYAAPEVNTQNEFTAQFLAQTLVDASRLIPVVDCDDIAPGDGAQHRITFQPGSAEWIFHSESHRKSVSYIGRASLRDLYIGSRKGWARLDERYAEDLLSRILALRNGATSYRFISSRQRSGTLRTNLPDARITAFARVADVLAAEFGVSMLILGDGDLS